MKLKKKGNTKPTLSDRIADALTVKPRADIEDDQVFGTKPQTVSRVDLDSESEDEAAISDFRKRNVNLLSEVSKKYEGQVVSRKHLEQSDSEGSGSFDDELSDNDIKVPTKGNSEQYAEDLLSKIKKSIAAADSDSDTDTKLQTKGKKEADSEDFDFDSGESDDYSITKFQKGDENNVDDEESDDDEDGEGIDISEMERPVKESFEHVKKQNISEEAKKGASVRNQLLLWEGLLEMRIHLQRCMNTANQMPIFNTFEEFKENNDFLEESNATKANVTNVLDKLLSLQNLLFKNYPETKSLSSKKADKQDNTQNKEESDEEIPSDTDNEEIPSDTEPESDQEEKTKTVKSKEVKTKEVTKKRKLEEYESELSSTHKALKTFRDSSIQKWNDKTRLATANMRNTPTNTVLQQISYILSDREKLVRRTQLKRSEFDIIGYKKPEEDNDHLELNPITRNRKDDDEYIPEIFDDSDFYHQLLRELIECKSADISDPVQLSRQWIALQQMRSKMKRKVDTKATKGRKIKYVVHNQLVNYMGPEQSLTWNDESRNELYSSLFGKMFEQDAGANGNARNFYKL